MNIIDITHLTSADFDAFLAVISDEDGASLDGLSGNGQIAVTAAFQSRGVTVPTGYWNPPVAVVAAYRGGRSGRDAELAILSAQDAYYDGQ